MDFDMYPRIFRTNQFELNKISPSWTPGILLSKEGLYALDDVADFLDIRTAKVKAEADRLRHDGKSVFQTIGVRKVFDRWVVLIEVFGSYYLRHLVPDLRSIKPHWEKKEKKATVLKKYLARVRL